MWSVTDVSHVPSGPPYDRDGDLVWLSVYSNLFAKQQGGIICVHLVLVYMHGKNRLACVLGTTRFWGDDRGACYY